MLPAASAGANPQPAIGIGKFQGTITPTTPSGSVKVTSTPPGDRDLPAEQPLRAPPRSSAGRRGRCRPPSARCRWCARRCAPRAAASSSTCAVDDVGEPAQQPGPVGRGDRAPGRQRRPRPGRSPRRCASASSCSTVVTTVLGRRVDRPRAWSSTPRVRTGRCGRAGGHSRSKPRTRSQSVTGGVEGAPARRRPRST